VQALNGGRVVVGHELGEDDRPTGGEHPLGVELVLVPQRYAVQGPYCLARGDLALGLIGLGAGDVGRDRDVGLEHAVVLPDALEVVIGQLHWRDLLGADQVRELGDRLVGERGVGVGRQLRRGAAIVVRQCQRMVKRRCRRHAVEGVVVEDRECLELRVEAHGELLQVAVRNRKPRNLRQCQQCVGCYVSHGGLLRRFAGYRAAAGALAALRLAAAASALAKCSSPNL